MKASTDTEYLHTMDPNQFTPDNFSYLQSGHEELGTDSDTIRRLLYLYSKAVDAIRTVPFAPPRSEGGKIRRIYCPVANERFLRVIHFINTHITPPIETYERCSENPLWDQMVCEVTRMFNGVDNDGNTRKTNEALDSGGESGYEYLSRMWAMPPELLPTTIALCIVRHYLKIMLAWPVWSDHITVRGQTVAPCREFFRHYSVLLLSVD